MVHLSFLPWSTKVAMSSSTFTWMICPPLYQQFPKDNCILGKPSNQSWTLMYTGGNSQQGAGSQEFSQSSKVPKFIIKVAKWAKIFFHKVPNELWHNVQILALFIKYNILPPSLSVQKGYTVYFWKWHITSNKVEKKNPDASIKYKNL